MMKSVDEKMSVNEAAAFLIERFKGFPFAIGPGDAPRSEDGSHLKQNRAFSGHLAAMLAAWLEAEKPAGYDPLMRMPGFLYLGGSDSGETTLARDALGVFGKVAVVSFPESRRDMENTLQRSGGKAALVELDDESIEWFFVTAEIEEFKQGLVFITAPAFDVVDGDGLSVVCGADFLGLLADWRSSVPEDVVRRFVAIYLCGKVLDSTMGARVSESREEASRALASLWENWRGLGAPRSSDSMPGYEAFSSMMNGVLGAADFRLWSIIA